LIYTFKVAGPDGGEIEYTVKTGLSLENARLLAEFDARSRPSGLLVSEEEELEVAVKRPRRGRVVEMPRPVYRPVAAQPEGLEEIAVTTLGAAFELTALYPEADVTGLEVLDPEAFIDGSRPPRRSRREERARRQALARAARRYSVAFPVGEAEVSPELLETIREARAAAAW
jgi:hypothetical protein